jgi:DNA-directed RNA polymerase specialized sigma24 family protein
MKTCFYCGKPLSTDPKQHQKHFCSQKCRKAFGWHKLNENGVSKCRAPPFPFAEWPEERKERWLKAWESDLGVERLNQLLRKPVPTEVIVSLRKSGLKYKAIGERLGITTKTIRQRIRRYKKSVAV